MNYFATLNQFHSGIPESFFRAIQHYDIFAMLLAVILILCAIVSVAGKLNNSKKLNDIERKKIYDRWDEAS